MNIKKIAASFVIFALAGPGIFWWLTRPQITPPEMLASIAVGNPDKGEKVFHASGCASCHARKGAKGEEKLKLGGGHKLPSPFGTFITPNISPDEQTGIGKWTFADFYNAMKHGVSPTGTHFYPSFPYTTYVRMTDGDVADLFAFMKTLPKVSQPNQPHELSFPFTLRRGVGLWKLVYMNDDYHLAIDESDEKLVRGRYIVEAMGHCAECHTPRNFAGGLISDKWLAGGIAPEGAGRIPNITPAQSGIGDWSEKDIIYSLETGFTPDFDAFGGTMVSVQENMAKLPKSDLEAIAAYLKAVPPVETKRK